MLCHYAEYRYAECRYAECHYGECRYAKCRGAFIIHSVCRAFRRHNTKHNGIHQMTLGITIKNAHSINDTHQNDIRFPCCLENCDLPFISNALAFGL